MADEEDVMPWKKDGAPSSGVPVLFDDVERGGSYGDYAYMDPDNVAYGAAG